MRLLIASQTAVKWNRIVEKMCEFLRNFQVLKLVIMKTTLLPITSRLIHFEATNIYSLI